MAARFEEVVLPHVDAAYNLARFMTRDPTAAEDIVQETLLRAFRSFSGYRGGDPKSWVLRIVRNCCATWRAASAADRATSTVDVDSLEDSHESTPEHAAEAQSEADAVRALIARLPDAYRETLVLREIEDLSYKQIAQVTDVPVGTVMSRLARARQLLADAAERLR